LTKPLKHGMIIPEEAAMTTVLLVLGALGALLVLRKMYVRFIATSVCPRRMDNGYCEYCDEGKDTISIVTEKG